MMPMPSVPGQPVTPVRAPAAPIEPTPAEDGVGVAPLRDTAEQAAQMARRAWLNDKRYRVSSGQRYTRFVDVMKFILPAVAIALVILLIAVSSFHKSTGELTLTFSDLKSVGETLEMRNPPLTYTDREARAFVVRADTAKQLPGGTERWRLETIRARMMPPKGIGYDLNSQVGVLDAEQETLDLAGDIEVISDEGYRFDARSAHVDLVAGRVSSEEPVRARVAGGAIEADRFELWDSGDRMRFEGRVLFSTDGPIGE